MTSFIKFRSTDNRGDTIVEVLISVTILALILGAAYTLSNTSYAHGNDAGERRQALSYAKEQAELLRAVAAIPPLPPSSPYPNLKPLELYKVNVPFCIPQARQDTDQPWWKQVDSPPNNPECIKNNLYKIRIDWLPPTAAAKSAFAITVNWESTGGARTDEVKIYFRPNGTGGY